MKQGEIDQAMQRAIQNHQSGRLTEARKIYLEVIERQPNRSDALHLLGVLACDEGRLDEGIELIQRAIAINPNVAFYHLNLGNALYRKGDGNGAVAAGREAVRLKPDDADAYHFLGNALCINQQPELAIVAYQQAIQINPNIPKVHNNLGVVLRDLGLLDEAIIAYQQAIQLQPDMVDAHNNLGITFFRKGDLDQAIAACRQAVALNPDVAMIHDSLICVLNYHQKSEAQMLQAEALEWARRHAQPLGQFIRPHGNDRSPDRRLKIGYVSPDFRVHPVGRYFLPLLEAHDPAQVEIFCYAQVARADAITERIRERAHHWRITVQLSDQQLADQIRNDKIDILIDLAGHTNGNRLQAFARKPAPVQVTWLGYPNTTGLRAMDYRLTDALADPPGLSDTLCTEQLIRLPRTAWCFAAPTEDVPLDKKPMTAATPIIFGSFNNFSKITTPMLELWAEILRSTPGSRFLIKANAAGCLSVRQRILQIMEAAGVTVDRLEAQGWRDSHEEHLAYYRQVHIALDTFPYHGTTTTCEALWMGVPVITLAGTTHLSRVGVSLLSNVGVPELIAQSPEQYIRLAVDLAKDVDRLNRLRNGLREWMRRSPLMDAGGFVRDMESAYRKMWRDWCAQTRV